MLSQYREYILFFHPENLGYWIESSIRAPSHQPLVDASSRNTYTNTTMAEGESAMGLPCVSPVHEWGASGAFTHRFYSGVLQNSSSINITESSPENYYTMSMPRPWFALIPVEINKFKRTQLKNDSEIRASSGTDWRITMSFNWLLSMCQSQIQFRLFNGNFESNRNN